MTSTTRDESTSDGQLEPSDQATTWQLWSPRLALAVFGAYLAAAVPLILFKFGNYAWFFQDDWDFLTNRSLSSPHDLLLAHNQHWSTIPIIVWKVLWSIFGLDSYRPYQAAVVLCHVTFLALLRVAIRRTGVGPWTATAVLMPLVLFGTGEQSLVMAFQINFLLPAIFGMAHLLLADHDGEWNKSDSLGVFFGLLALMSSGVGVFMVAVVGLVVLIRRGWRIAALHVGPLAVIFVAWYLAFSAGNIEVEGYHQVFGPWLLIRWTFTSLRGAFEGIVANNFGLTVPAALALVAIIVAGLSLTFAKQAGADLQRRLSIPFGMALAGVGFLVFSGVGRGIMGVQGALGGRYLYMAATFTAPLLAVAADELIRRWKWAFIPFVAILALGIPTNLDRFGATVYGEAYFKSYRTIILGIAADPRAAEVPGDAYPYRDLMPGPRARWLSAMHAAGEIPDPPELSAAQTAQIGLRLSLNQSSEPSPTKDCQTGSALEFRLKQGETLGVRADNPGAKVWPGSVIQVDQLGPYGGTRATTSYFSGNGFRYEVLSKSLHLRISSPGSRSVKVCRANSDHG